MKIYNLGRKLEKKVTLFTRKSKRIEKNISNTFCMTQIHSHRNTNIVLPCNVLLQIYFLTVNILNLLYNIFLNTLLLFIGIRNVVKII